MLVSVYSLTLRLRVRIKFHPMPADSFYTRDNKIKLIDVVQFVSKI